MSATQQGVDARSHIYGRAEQERANELAEGGVDIKTLLKPGEEPAVEVLMPEGYSTEEWGAMSDESRGLAWQQQLAKGDAKEPEKKEAEAGGDETEEARKLREDAEAKAAEEAAAKKKADDEAAAAAAPKRKIKVDGQEIEVTDSELIEAGIRAKQKIETGDRRLEEATRILNEAKQHRETLGDPSKKDGPGAGEMDTRAIAHAIQYGSEEEASEALKKLKTADGKPGLTAEQVVYLADERTAFQAAKQWYQNDAKDVATDPNLHQLFLTKENQKRQAGDSRPYLELYGEIVKEIRDWVGTKAPKKDPLQEKRDRKAATPPHPTSAALRTPAPQETKPPSPSQVVADMRRQRGQPV